MKNLPLSSFGLKEITLADKPVLDAHFQKCPTPLSDYSFANTYIWREAIHLRWHLSHDCLCVFANGDGGLTMLFPPLGQGDARRALADSVEICREYNTRTKYDRPTRVEYVSAELLKNFPGEYCARPMSGDYIYSTKRMIELDGSDLASKRKARHRFERLYQARTEKLQLTHVPQCVELLKRWHAQAEPSEPAEPVELSIAFKRAKEGLATLDALTHADELGLCGMVLYAGDQLAGFTLGEMLSPNTCSILIEKTDRSFKGSAQYIFSQFCKDYWSHTEWCNVGDDWEIPSLAWTKESYRPAARLKKWTLYPPSSQRVETPSQAPALVEV